jgi:hypothetical protein
MQFTPPARSRLSMPRVRLADNGVVARSTPGHRDR